MFSKKIYYIVSLLVIALFASACSTKKAGSIADPCSKDPKWYSQEKCPKGYICGFGTGGSSNSSTAEFKAKGEARTDLAANLEIAVSKVMIGGINEMEGAQDLEQDVLDTKIRFSVQRVLSNTAIHEKEKSMCDGKNWYWVAVKKDLDGVDYNTMFKEIAKEAKLPEATQQYIEEVNDWGSRVERELGY
jgi:hypothetical protein|tara:strand:+ start:1261 stop:1827 length:567 start_codon:yes stop_codon:yes gene_type:complete